MSMLDLRNVSMHFGGLVAVSGLDVTVEKADIVGLIGPNGAGKTTVFNVISGFYEPTEGKVLFRGEDIAGLRPDQVAKLGIARIFQGNRLFERLSVLENVMVARHLGLHSSVLAAILKLPAYREQEAEARETCMELLAALELDSVSQEHPNSLPHGLQRKLEVARALATQPNLLLLDEPATGLNAEETSDMMTFILKVHRDFDLTILLIEHTMRVVMGICPRIVVLSHGRKIAEGPPNKIRSNPEVIEAYLGASANA